MANWIHYEMPDGYYCKSVSEAGTPAFRKRFDAQKETYVIDVTQIWGEWQSRLLSRYLEPIHTLDGFETSTAAAVAMELYLSELIAL